MTERDRLLEQLEAYHDGELRGLARWRLERRVRRDPELRRALERLGQIGDAVREAGRAAPGPELWDRIALRLPAADRGRALAREEARLRTRRRWLVAAPLGVAVAATLAVLLMPHASPPTSEGVVRWMNAGRRSVYVRDDPGPGGATIIWILHDPMETAARRPDRDHA